jgi:hypothetical protein
MLFAPIAETGSMFEREPRELMQATALTCIECRREWLEPNERWRIYLTADARPEPVLYCANCAAFEFDP